MPLTQHEIVDTAIQELIDKLSKDREAGLIPDYDTIFPSRLVGILDNIYTEILSEARVTDQEKWKTKMFSLAIIYRMSINDTIGIDYFMDRMKDAKKMKAMDKLISDLSEGLRKDDDIKRQFR